MSSVLKSPQMRGGDDQLRLRQTCKRAVASDVVSDEAGGEHQQDHEQLEPGESTALHLHLQVLRRQQREEASPRSEPGWTIRQNRPDTGCCSLEGPGIQQRPPSPRWLL